jgi:predicted SAM-dependent methyltransferase
MSSEFPSVTFGKAPVQPPFDAAVVIPTRLRPSLLQAVRSVFAQSCTGRIQILIGIDRPDGDPNILQTLKDECPERMAITVLNLGYSTAAKHGGLSDNPYAGELRTVMSYAANSDHICYLDDDNWWAPHHISGLLNVVEGFDWAFSLRWFVDSSDDRVLCVDNFESVGPGRGVYNSALSGFVDTNCMLLVRSCCRDVFPYWSMPLFSDGTGEDRSVFERLRGHHSVAWNPTPSVYYRLGPDTDKNPGRKKILERLGIEFGPSRSGEETPQQRNQAISEAYFNSHNVAKLNVGAGPNPLPGWLNADLWPQHPEIMALNAARRLPFDDNTFDRIATEHMVEHISLQDGYRFFCECFRLLKPGGRIRVATPDLARFLALFRRDPNELQCAYMDWITRSFIAGVNGRHPTLVLNNVMRNWGHQFIYDQSILRSVLEDVGFRGFQRFEAGNSDDDAFKNIERHGQVIGNERFNAYETLVLEAMRPSQVGKG